MGSGSGSPGLIFAAVRDDIEVTLLEPRLKRWVFLREAARAMRRPGVFVRQERHDTYVGPPAQTVTLRALRLPLGALTPLVEEDGRLLVFGDEPESVESFVAERGAGGPACRVYRRCST